MDAPRSDNVARAVTVTPVVVADVAVVVAPVWAFVSSVSGAAEAVAEAEAAENSTLACGKRNSNWILKTSSSRTTGIVHHSVGRNSALAQLAATRSTDGGRRTERQADRQTNGAGLAKLRHWGTEALQAGPFECWIPLTFRLGCTLCNPKRAGNQRTTKNSMKMKNEK